MLATLKSQAAEVAGVGCARQGGEPTTIGDKYSGGDLLSSARPVALLSAGARATRGSGGTQPGEGGATPLGLETG